MNKKDNVRFSFTKYISWQIEPTEGFIYILNHKTNMWLYLNDISKDIWLLIEKRKNIKDITNELVEKYQIEFEIIYNDVCNFIEGLYMEGLIIKNEIS